MRIKNVPSFHKQRERSLYRFLSFSSSRLYQDFSDDNGGNDNEEVNNRELFSDFDFVIGDETAASDDGVDDNDKLISPAVAQPSSMSILQQRFQKIALAEQMGRQQISENWKEGYWGVWGCSLDPFTTEDTKTKTVITCVRQMTLSLEDDASNDDSTVLIVGRSDGSMCWLQMETSSSLSFLSSSQMTSPTDNDPNSSVENRSVTTYFENKLTAKATDDGGMIVDTMLQRQEHDGTNDSTDNKDNFGWSSPRLPFDILAQIQTSPSTPTGYGMGVAIVEILQIPSARMLWFISRDAPNSVRGWNLVPDTKTGCLLPCTSQKSFDIDSSHTSPIIGLKIIPHCDDYNESKEVSVISVSDNGQVIVWGVTTEENESSPSIRIRVDTNLLQEQPEEQYDKDDSILSMDIDDQYLYLGSKHGEILIFSLSSVIEKSIDTFSMQALPLVKRFIAFTSRNPGVSSLLAAGTGILNVDDNATNSDNDNFKRPQKNFLIAGSASGELKQWELIQVGKDRLEYWPRMGSQKLSGGKAHTYETRDSSFEYRGDDQNFPSFSPAIKELLCIQQVLLSATDCDLTVWDSSSGKALYDMQGLNFALGVDDSDDNNDIRQRPSLIAANDSILITNGMENYVCVHDFTMDRIDTKNAKDFLEDIGGVSDDDTDSVSGFENDDSNNW